MKAMSPKARAIKLYEAWVVSVAKNSPLSNKVMIIGSDKSTKPKMEGIPIKITNLKDQSIVFENPSLSEF